MVKVAEWQQTYYASDSGIQSGATTVRDDESSTEYSGNKKYISSTTTSTNIPTATGGGGDTAASGLESPTGETFDQKSLVISSSSVWGCLVYFILLGFASVLTILFFVSHVNSLSLFIIRCVVFIVACTQIVFSPVLVDLVFC